MGSVAHKRAGDKILRERNSVQRRIAEAVCATALCANNLERNVARVKTEKQAWEAQAMEAEETLETLAEKQETY